MAQSKNALIQIETGQNLVASQAMSDSGDQTVFNVSGGTIFSGKSGYSASVKPNGIVTGSNLLSTHASNDTVTIAAFTAYSKGVLQSVSATTGTITRPTTDNLSQVFSVTMASDGSIETVEGTIGTDTNFSETRGVAGGPPLIPVNSVEIGQVRIISNTAATITTDEIKQVPSVHTEISTYPNWTVNNIGEGSNASASAKKNAFVEFDSALPNDHVGSIPKSVYIEYYSPIFSSLQLSKEFVPVENSHSVSSEEFYGNKSIASVSSSIGQGSFQVVASDGITDTLVREKDEILTVKFFQDRNKAPYLLTQGTVGLSRSFPVDGQAMINATISSEVISAEFSS